MKQILRVEELVANAFYIFVNASLQGITDITLVKTSNVCPVCRENNVDYLSGIYYDHRHSNQVLQANFPLNGFGIGQEDRPRNNSCWVCDEKTLEKLQSLQHGGEAGYVEYLKLLSNVGDDSWMNEWRNEWGPDEKEDFYKLPLKEKFLSYDQQIARLHQ